MAMSEMVTFTYALVSMVMTHGVSPIQPSVSRLQLALSVMTVSTLWEGLNIHVGIPTFLPPPACFLVVGYPSCPPLCCFSVPIWTFSPVPIGLGGLLSHFPVLDMVFCFPPIGAATLGVAWLLTTLA
jgi:hypothetical protein